MLMLRVVSIGRFDTSVGLLNDRMFRRKPIHRVRFPNLRTRCMMFLRTIPPHPKIQIIPPDVNGFGIVFCRFMIIITCK